MDSVESIVICFIEHTVIKALTTNIMYFYPVTCCFWIHPSESNRTIIDFGRLDTIFFAVWNHFIWRTIDCCWAPWNSNISMSHTSVIHSPLVPLDNSKMEKDKMNLVDGKRYVVTRIRPQSSMNAVFHCSDVNFFFFNVGPP